MPKNVQAGKAKSLSPDQTAPRWEQSVLGIHYLLIPLSRFIAFKHYQITIKDVLVV